MDERFIHNETTGEAVEFIRGAVRYLADEYLKRGPVEVYGSLHLCPSSSRVPPGPKSEALRSTDDKSCLYLPVVSAILQRLARAFAPEGR